MPTELLTPRKSPCASCPYRRGVPSGIWSAEEYDKLPGYDGDIQAQIHAEATGLFMCHQGAEELCAGWVGCHDMQNNFAIRFHYAEVDLEAVKNYISPVPLYTSGRDACRHGKKRINNPPPEAAEAARKITEIREMRGKPVND